MAKSSTTWSKGMKSPNPKGRPKSDDSISQAFRDRLASPKELKKFVDTMFNLLYEKNNLSAGVEITNRVEGKVKERVEFTDDLTDHIPDQETQLALLNKFKYDVSEEKTTENVVDYIPKQEA